MNIRLLLSVLLEIKLQEKMMGALGVRNKVRSIRSSGEDHIFTKGYSIDRC